MSLQFVIIRDKRYRNRRLVFSISGKDFSDQTRCMYMRVSSDTDRQNTDLQRDVLLNAGVDNRHLFEERASGARDDRPGLVKALAYIKSGDVLVV